MSEVQRLAGIVVFPRRTFADINQRPSWLLPLLLLILLNFAINFVVYRVIVTETNFDQVARAKIAWDARETGKPETPQTTEQAVTALRQQRDQWYIFPLPAVLISTVGLSVFFYLVLLLARAGASFVKVFAVVCWSFVVYRVVGGIVTLATLLIRGSGAFFPAPPEAWSPTSLAHVVARTAVSANAYSAISKIDVFLVWWLVVMSIGFWQTSRNLSLVRSAWIVGLSEAAYLVLNAMGVLAGVA